ncbi:MAG: HepT-like ribonuclease domain-containing protein [Bacteroidota bacterium]
MDKKVRKWLFDILLAIEGIESLIERTQGDYEIFAADLGLCWGFERGFEIIGEALNRIERQHPGIGITDLKGYIDMRNIISHGYDIVSY